MNVEDIGTAFEEAMQKVAETMEEFGKMYRYMRYILELPQGHTPIEYARMRAGRMPQRITPHRGSRYIPCCHAASGSMIWKKGRWKKRRI